MTVSRPSLRDPRLGQIAALATLLTVGRLWLDFPVMPLQVLVLLLATQAAQLLATRFFLGPAGRFDPLSPLVTALSLSLLLRSNLPSVLALAGAAAILSKFVLRWRGKHVFNPAAFGIAVAVLGTGQAWISPGQWGSTTTVGLLAAGMGCLVVYRAMRADVALGFLGCYAAVLFARSWWLGEPAAIPLHRLDNGALLVFAFFMITDPKTTPDARAGRLLHVAAVALGAGFVHFVLYRSSGFLWALLALAPLVPSIDRLFPAERYRWAAARLQEPHTTSKEDADMPRSLLLPRPSARLAGFFALLCLVALLVASRADAFCGFYVAKADTRLFNQASQVVMVRDGDRTVITMANDYRGAAEEFALVVPVPTVLQRGQVHVADQALIDHLDAYTAPRLVEYHDEDPCRVRPELKTAFARGVQEAASAPGRDDADLHVRIEAKYTVGEYDILILSAEESDGLEIWLRRNGYRIPAGASRVLDGYLKQGMRFFVAKVNLEQQAKLGYMHLRPLQLAFEHRRFMLPIRLGTVNADGSQELFVYALTRNGRVETTNYRTVKLESGVEIPTFVEDEFGAFYRALFDHAVEQERRRAVFLEYAWDMSWCDPCAADPLSPQELRQLGVFWVDSSSRRGQGTNTFVTRLHLRYDGESFPEDLAFQQTADRTNFQGRYVMRQPWRGAPTCEAARSYLAQLPNRFEQEARNLARITGWELEVIRQRMALDDFPPTPEPTRWWQRLWPGN